MGNVTAHFEFSGTFWTVVGLLLVAGVVFYWREELKVVVEKLRQTNQEA